MLESEWEALKRMAEVKFRWGSMEFKRFPYSDKVVLSYEPYKRMSKEWVFSSSSEIDSEVRVRLKVLYDKYYDMYHTQ
ncbi:MAG: hypothetical protein VW270_29710 [Candidatus Poseidoniales archaeon]